MKVSLFAALVAAATIACAAERTVDRTPSGPTLPPTSLPMPPVVAESGGRGWMLLDGNRETLAEQAGRVLVLDFYATWCGPCRESTPHLVQLQRRYGPQGLRVVGLNVGGPDDRFKVADFVREFAVQYDLGYPDQALTDLLFASDTRIPQTFIFDRRGQLIQRFVGFDSDVAAKLERAIAQALADR
ncbi:TlpA disulfide reductase family protein [Pyrinomonas sp.]|uniref:TlpA family protein disulfide reductase n=1 Tax=Pyrinomonas sp. TaxID=2080306 RepID=UPI00333104FA